jgi:hypothetical protein
MLRSSDRDKAHNLSFPSYSRDTHKIPSYALHIVSEPQTNETIASLSESDCVLTKALKGLYRSDILRPTCLTAEDLCDLYNQCGFTLDLLIMVLFFFLLPIDSDGFH